MANEKRLIDANALTDEIIFVKKCLAADDKAGEWTKGYRSGLEASLSEILDLPTVDAVEVVHGKWIMGIDEGDYEYGTCSVCGYNEYNAFCCLLPHNYCPNCGAKMDGDVNGSL